MNTGTSLEILKKLDQSGFPIKKSNGIYKPVEDKEGEGFIPPTLSELIEACGDNFGYLLRYSNDWSVTPNINNIDHLIEYRGSTPEIAVSKFWLALQNKL